MSKSITIELDDSFIVDVALSAHKLDLTMNSFIVRALRNLVDDAKQPEQVGLQGPKYLVGDVLRHKDANERSPGAIVRSLSPSWDDVGRPDHQYYVENIDDRRSSTLREIDAVLVKRKEFAVIDGKS